MLSTRLLNELNKQLNYELYSSYTYLAMASYSESIDFSGFANFFKVQAKEELFHAMKIYDFIFQKNENVVLEQIEKPIINFSSLTEVVQKGYEHEQVVTQKFYNLSDIANEDREHSTISLLKWFVDEQVEEENTFNTLLKKIKRIEGNEAAISMLDDELATRVFTPPTNA